MHIETDKFYNTIFKSIYLPCEDQVELLKVQKIFYEDGDIEYMLSIVDSCQYNKSGILKRIKRAFKVLFGKETYYGDIIVNRAKMRDFVSTMNILVDEEVVNESKDRNN